MLNLQLFYKPENELNIFKRKTLKPNIGKI